MEPTTEQKRGFVLTFYSFKGGVGRSMALANVAALLAKWGQRVLIVDWDLEAPGIEKFFEKWLSGSRRSTPGLVDLVGRYSSGAPTDWRSCLLQVTLPQAQRIQLLSAGQDDGEYGKRLRDINWERLFAERDFGAYLEQLRRDWLAEYDFVLVDSRTGITDIGGICTIHLPDALVCLFTTTEQSLFGVKDVMERARRAHASLPVDRHRLLVIPVPARDESRTEYKLAAEWRARFSVELESFYADWIPKDELPSTVLDLLKIPYVAFWSFGERLPVLEEDLENPDKLAFFYQLIARLVLGHLDLREVKQGGMAARAAEAQKAEAAKRAQDSAAAREQAQREAAEKKSAQREREAAAQKERYEQYLQTRWEPVVRRYVRLRATFRYALPAAIAVLILLALGFPDQWRPVSATMSSVLSLAQVELTLSVFGVIAVGASLFIAARYSKRINELLQERALFEGQAGRYRWPDRALIRFLEISERIIARNLFSPPVEEKKARVDESAPALPTQIPTLAEAARPEETAAPAPESSTLVVTADRDYDVYISYRRDAFTGEWLKEFLPLFTSWLSDLLGREAAVFLDQTIRVDEPVQDAMPQALQSSTCMIAIVSPTYFQSEPNNREWRGFVARRPGSVLPVLLRGSVDLLPEELRRVQVADFRDYAFVGEGFQKTTQYIDFQVEIRRVAERAAELIKTGKPVAAS